MSNWNPYTRNYNQSYSNNSYNQLYSPDSAYDSPQQSIEGDDCVSEWQAAGSFDRRASGSYSLATDWTGAGGVSLNAQQAAFTRNVPFDYGALSSASSGPSSAAISIPNAAVSQAYFSDTEYVANPANLQYVPEVPLSPVEDQEEEIRAQDEDEEDVLESQPKKKRGRPKLNRQESSSSSKGKVSQRVPHNQVERKYRETLNAEMERLRVNIPTLPQHDGSSLAGPPRPSKATVLSAAVDYIKQLEAETERLAEQNENLRSGLP